MSHPHRALLPSTSQSSPVRAPLRRTVPSKRPFLSPLPPCATCLTKAPHIPTLEGTTVLLGAHDLRSPLPTATGAYYESSSFLSTFVCFSRSATKYTITVTPILQRSKLTRRENKKLARGHTAPHRWTLTCAPAVWLQRPFSEPHNKLIPPRSCRVKHISGSSTRCKRQ